MRFRSTFRFMDHFSLNILEASLHSYLDLLDRAIVDYVSMINLGTSRILICNLGSHNASLPPLYMRLLKKFNAKQTKLRLVKWLK
jgi:hypothetical protein